MLPSWVERYVGIPFSDCGRSMDGADCYGLVRLVIGYETGFWLPELCVYERSDCSVFSVVSLVRPLFPVNEVLSPRDLDVVLMFLRGQPVHLGLWVSGFVLHTLRATGSVLHRADSVFFRGRRCEFFRVRGL